MRPRPVADGFIRAMLLSAVVAMTMLGAGRAAAQLDDSYPPKNGDGMPIGGNQEPQPKTPTITVKARLVVLDVVVTDKKGSLVWKNDLKPEDFKIYEDGQLQTIRSFEAPSRHRMPQEGTAIVHSAADLKKIGDAPVTILVLDELNSTFQDSSFSRQQMVKYLQSQPEVLKQPTVLMVAMNTTFQQLHDYTQDRDALIDAVKKHMPEYPWAMMGSGKSGPGAVERMAQNLAALQQIARASSGTPGRKNLIWVGNGFPSANLVGLPQDEADQIEAAYRRCTAELLAARVTMFTINPTADTTVTVEADDTADLDSTGDEGGPDPMGEGAVSFASFAADTGGIAYMGRNDLNHVMDEGIARGQEYYTMSYTPTNASEVAVKFRSIKIVMADKNLRALTRDGYYPETAADLNPVAATQPNTKANQKLIKSNLELDISGALTTQISYNGLDVKVVKSGADEYTLTVTGNGIGWTDPGPNGEQHEEATVVAGWYDAKDKLLGHVAREEVCPRPAGNGGCTYKLPVTLTGKPVRLRFLVRDALNGRMGTADVKF
jgi:VWFA-related protein